MAKRKIDFKSNKLHFFIKLGAALLCIVAFCLMFANQLTFKLLGDSVNLPFSTVFFGEKQEILGSIATIYKGASLGFVGYLFILVGGVIPVILSFLKLKGTLAKFLPIGLGALIVITGAIFVFAEGKAFSDANNLTVNLLFAPVLAGILALLSVVANVSTLFLPKLVK